MTLRRHMRVLSSRAGLGLCGSGGYGTRVLFQGELARPRGSPPGGSDMGTHICPGLPWPVLLWWPGRAAHRGLMLAAGCVARAVTSSVINRRHRWDCALDTGSINCWCTKLYGTVLVRLSDVCVGSVSRNDRKITS